MGILVEGYSVEKLVSVGVVEDSTSGSLWELVHCWCAPNHMVVQGEMSISHLTRAP